MKKVISFSLWGNDNKYIQGAIENARMKADNFADWTLRYYINSNVPNLIELIQTLQFYGGHIIIRDDIGYVSRFEAIFDGTCDVVIVRDTDSRLTRRDVGLVDQWMESNSPIHVVRDHPHHRSLMMAGMFGVRCGDVSEMFGKEFINYKKNVSGFETRRGLDQQFLNTCIFPKIKDIAFVQSEYFKPNGNERPYGIARENEYDFLGNVYDEHNNPTCKLEG